MTESESSEKISRGVTEALVRFTVVLLTAYLCLKIFAPFMGLVVWALVMAISLYPIHQKIAAKFSNKQGLTSTVMVVVTLLAFGVPLILLSNSLVVLTPLSNLDW